MAPYFKSYIKRGTQDTSNTNDSNGNSPNSASKDQLVSMIEKRIYEVEIGLFHLQVFS